MKLTTKQLTLCAVLTAMALALSYLENFFPLSLAIPVPGIKLGLANIVTVFALYVLAEYCGKGKRCFTRSIAPQAHLLRRARHVDLRRHLRSDGVLPDKCFYDLH